MLNNWKIIIHIVIIYFISYRMYSSYSYRWMFIPIIFVGLDIRVNNVHVFEKLIITILDIHILK